MTFGERLRAALDDRGPLCVGIDPHTGLLRNWGLPTDAAGVREFGLRVVEAAAGRVAVVKPQVAFFERYGSAGFAALEEVLAAARAAGLLVIGDAKRGDIGSTADAYAAAWLSAGSPLEVDALTVSPYLGVGALGGTAELARANGKGLFVLAATSNPEGVDVQAAERSGRSVAAAIVEQVRSLTEPAPAAGALASNGVVVGATIDLAAVGLTRESLVGLPVLAPGFGHQGASLGDLDQLFGPASASVLASVSRSVLGAGPQGVAAAIDEARAELGARA